jgi:hypothetical protein
LPVTYMLGSAARGLLYIARHGWRRDANPETVFTNELAVWDVTGFMYGKYLTRGSKRSAGPPPASSSRPTGGTPA